MRSFLLKTSLLALLTVPASGLSFNQAYASLTCEVPVCSIQDTLVELRTMTGDQRGMFAINLKDRYKDSTDVNALMNLRESGIAMKSLFLELGDADWVQRAASDIVAGAVFNLAKLSTNGEEMVSYYKELSNQNSRYNLISFWQTRLSQVEDLELLQELIVFADGARTHSISISDEDWVPRAAGSLISEITMKLTHLDPAHEGLYEVQVSGSQKAIDALGFDRIAVLDSSSSKNLVVAFINSRLKVIVHSFSQAEIMGNTVKGLSLSNGVSSVRFSFDLDRRSGRIEGTVETTNETVEFSGAQLRSTRSVFEGEAPHAVTKKDVVGTMRGELGGIKGRLTVRSFQENVYSAVFASDNGSVILNFQGKLNSKKGVLSLTSQDKIKLTLSLRDNSWSGFSFSAITGTSSEALFSAIQ